ncbi:MAG: M20 family metallo-hydrolase [Clostridiales bacterium]|nr:M20 family metallo-hydrolase [Clostridiales bacterium]
MVINGERLISHLKEVREFTDTPGNGVTRFSYSENDSKVREYILDKARSAGCSIETDAVGNIRLGLKNNTGSQKIIVCGSHIDTVRNGGWLDGIYGSLSSLEVMLTLSENSYSGRYGFETVIFAEEEGSNFGSTMTGSKFITGIYGDEDLDRLKDDSGRTLREYLSIDSLPDDIIWDFDRYRAMFELHIEQGPVLDRENIPIGIINAVFGMRTVEITVTGVGNHAGATPMSERFDALSAAALCILSAERIVSEDPDRRTVATAGKMSISPNCSNVIPESVTFTLEIRDSDIHKIDSYMEKVLDEIRNICADRKCTVSIREHSKGAPVILNEDIRKRMIKTAKKKNLTYKVMDSGAVHDAAMIAPHIDTGMIFVPSIEGRSHVPFEDTKTEDLVTGAQFLLDVITGEME